MNAASLIPMLIFGAVMVFFMSKVMKNSRLAGASGANIDAAQRAFTERLGYTTVVNEQSPKTGIYRTEMVRRTANAEIYFRTHTTYNGRAMSTMVDWSSALGRMPRVRFDFVDASVVGDVTSEKMKNMLLNIKTHFEPQSKNLVQTGDPELDRRFRLFSDDPAAAIQIVRDPAFRFHVLSFPFINLSVSERGVFFNDPSNKNLDAAMASIGGRLAMMTPAGIEAQVGLHERVSHLLVELRNRV